MYRIKYLLGSMVAVFSLVYLLFGIVGWVDGNVGFADLLTCFVLASVHLGVGGYLLLSSLREYKTEKRRVDTVVRRLIHDNGGRVLVNDVARLAEISDDDAREYLSKRSKVDVSIVLQGKEGEDVYFFGQQFWNN
jgi:hypothetical protein